MSESLRILVYINTADTKCGALIIVLLSIRPFHWCGADTNFIPPGAKAPTSVNEAEAAPGFET